MSLIFLVALGGGIGACLRLLIDLMAISIFNPSLPWALLFINLTGVIAFTLFNIRHNFIQPLKDKSKAFWQTGIIASYTTISGINFEVYKSYYENNFYIGIIYLFMTISLGIIISVILYRYARYNYKNSSTI